MKKLFKKKGTTWQKNKGSLPSNLLEISNADNKNQYLRACKLINVKPHPARFPLALPEFFIKFLTDENDLVVDIFGGSNSTGYVCETLNRKWRVFEMSQEYVATSSFRFINCIDDAQRCYDEIMNSSDIVDLSEFIAKK